jgi:hypothetical protein
MKKPAVVYRYINLSDVDRLQELFVDSRLYFPKPGEFNDPFEFKPKRIATNTAGMDREVVEKYIDPALERAYERICTELDGYGVCCFSESRANITMWSHYAERHAGACVGFDTGNDFFQNLNHVDYDYERHDFDLGNDSPEEIVRKVMLRKYESWMNEQEWRLLRKPGGESVRIDPSMLTEVIFGDRCPESRRKLVRKLLEHRNVTFLQAQVDRYEYKLNIIPCTGQNKR